MRFKKVNRPEKKNESVFSKISKQSIKKDFNKNKIHIKEEPKPERKEEPKENSERRVQQINETSAYAKYSRFIIGKLVRIKSKSTIGSSSYNVEFVFDEDRKALNRAGEWSDMKRDYLLDGVKFK